MFWSGGLPLRRLADVAAEAEEADAAQVEAEEAAEVDRAYRAPAFVDVAQWPGCEDVTWVALPPGAKLYR